MRHRQRKRTRTLRFRSGMRLARTLFRPTEDSQFCIRFVTKTRTKDLPFRTFSSDWSLTKSSRSSMSARRGKKCEAHPGQNGMEISLLRSGVR